MKKQMGTTYPAAPGRLTHSYTVWRNIVLVERRETLALHAYKNLYTFFFFMFGFVPIEPSLLSLIQQFHVLQVVPSRNTHFLCKKHFCAVSFCFPLCCARIQVYAFGETSVQVSSCNYYTPAFILLVFVLLYSLEKYWRLMYQHGSWRLHGDFSFKSDLLVFLKRSQ